MRAYPAFTVAGFLFAAIGDNSSVFVVIDGKRRAVSRSRGVWSKSRDNCRRWSAYVVRGQSCAKSFDFATVDAQCSGYFDSQPLFHICGIEV